MAVTRGGVLGTLALLVVVGICIRLGFWQLARLEERRERNAAVAGRLVEPAVTDPSELADTAGLFFRTATVNGVYDLDRSIVLPGRSLRGVPGVHLLTPLRLDGRPDAVLVNRGWVPSPDAATIDVADFAEPDTLSVHGLLLPFPGAAESLAQRGAPGGGDGFRRVWYTVDAAQLQAQFPYTLLPITVQQLPDDATPATQARYPVRLEPPPLDEGPHLGYALQWFSFALIGIIGWIALVLRDRSPPRVVAPPALLLLALGGSAAPVQAQLRPADAPAERLASGRLCSTDSDGISRAGTPRRT